MKIAFIGGGNMGTAMFSILLNKGLVSPQAIAVCEISSERCDFLKKEYGISVTDDAVMSVKDADVIVLAVKPQYIEKPIADLKEKVEPGQLVLSIMAGVTIKTLTDGLGHGSIVRVMPNTPAQIGEGMSVWTATAEVTAEQKEMAATILGAIGKELYVDDEKYLDMATAVMGSGPAYFFLFAEALIEAAEEIGFAPDVAKMLVLQTMLGSGHLIEKSDKSPAELREMVTSKGGTTAEALGVFDRGEFRSLVKRAVQAAYDRAIALGGEKK
ncbi:pyrroline-5-carboxylate reductase [Chloroflexota bacterium]